MLVRHILYLRSIVRNPMTLIWKISTEKSLKHFKLSKQGRPPQESEKGAVRCGRRASSHYVVSVF